MNQDEETVRWDLQLSRMAAASTSEFQTFAREIFSCGPGRDYVVERLRDSHLGNAAWRLATWDVEETVKNGDDGWIGSAQSWLESSDADWGRSASFCADVAWAARAARNSALLHIDSTDLPSRISTPADRGLLHILIQSQRYDFRFRSIRETVASLRIPLVDLDPFSRAVHAFALLGQNADTALDEFAAVSQLGGGHEKVAHALLHGLWMATRLPDQANRILDLIELSEVLRDNDPIVALRRAYALRKLRRYDDAIQALDLGMLNLSPASVEVHQDFTRERAMILVVQEIEELYGRERQILDGEAARHVRELSDAVTAKADQIENKISESLFKMIEILALFTAVVALLASGVASVTIGDLEWWQRGALILTSGAVVMTFFFAIRAVVQPRRSRNSAAP